MLIEVTAEELETIQAALVDAACACSELAENTTQVKAMREREWASRYRILGARLSSITKPEETKP